MILSATGYYRLSESTGFDETADVEAADYSSCDTVTEACYQAMQENQQNWNRFYQNIALYELNYLRENGMEVVYEEEEVVGDKKTSFVSKAIAIIKSWMSKVWGIIDKAITQVRMFVANATKWIGVNKKVTNPVWPTGKSFDDYDYHSAVANLDTVELANIGEMNLDSKSYDDDSKAFGVEAILYDVVEKACGSKKASCTVKEIKDHVLGKKITFSGSTRGYSYQECINKITNVGTTMKKLNEEKKNIKDLANEMISKLRKAKSGYRKDKNDDAVKGVNGLVAAINRVTAFNTTLVTAKLQMIMGDLSVARKCAGAWSSGARKTEKAKKTDEKAGAAEDANAAETAATEATSLMDVLGFELV